MKLYMKQKVFSLHDRFYIKDENGNDRYYVEGEIFTLGKKLHIYDNTGNEVAFVSQKIFSFLPRFFVYVNGVEIAEIVKEFTFFKPKYSIKGPDWSVNGDFWSHDYEIDDHGTQIVSIHKVWMSWGDSFVLDITKRENEVQALAVVLAIDCVMDAQEAAVAN